MQIGLMVLGAQVSFKKCLKDCIGMLLFLWFFIMLWK